jgi:hypothetical protein
MKNNPIVFVTIVAALRVAAVSLILSTIYSTLVPFFFQFGFNSGMLGLAAINLVRPLIAALALWFLARPIGKFVLRDFEKSMV